MRKEIYILKMSSLFQSTVISKTDFLPDACFTSINIIKTKNAFMLRINLYRLSFLPPEKL